MLCLICIRYAILSSLQDRLRRSPEAGDDGKVKVPTRHHFTIAMTPSKQRKKGSVEPMEARRPAHHRHAQHTAAFSTASQQPCAASL
jgi:hypothetical protein